MPLQSQVIPICVTQNSCFFGTFLEKILFLTHFDQSNPPHDRHIRKAVHLRIPKIRLKFDFRHPMERQIFGDGGGLDPALILALCLTDIQILCVVTDRLPTDALPMMATSSPETGRRQEWKLASNSWKINFHFKHNLTNPQKPQ